MISPLECVVVETAKEISCAVIWLHGLGADGYDFQPIVENLALPDSLGVRFIFPHAQMRPVTINGGMKMRAWYDILEMSLDRKVDMANIEESCQQVLALIEEQLSLGVASEQIILAGFSQGGVIAYHLGLRCQYPLAGIMALSTYLVDSENTPDSHDSVNGQTPILIHHGTMDSIVLPQQGEQARQQLQSKGYDIQSQTYPMAHAVCPAQIGDISRWLQQQLSANR